MKTSILKSGSSPAERCWPVASALAAPVDQERQGFTPQNMAPKNSEGTTNPKRLISFDIDGTMEFGDPPGQVTAQWVKLAKEQGTLVGSASDRPLAEQRRVWAPAGIELDFVILKHWMLELRTTFQADEYWHVGDGQMDQLFAKQAGFTFFIAHTFPQDVLAHVNGQNGFGHGEAKA